MGYPWQFLLLSLRAHGVLRSGSLGRLHFISNVLSSSALDIFRGDDRLDQPELASHYPLIGPGYLYGDPARSGGGARALTGHPLRGLDVFSHRAQTEFPAGVDGQSRCVS